MIRIRAWHAITLAAAITAGCEAKSPATVSGGAPKGETAKPQAAGEEAAQPQTTGPQLVAPSNDAQVTPADTKGKDDAGPQKHTSFYRVDAAPAKIPKVAFSKREEALCKVKVGDAMPAIALPQIGGNGAAKLGDLFGKKATVVVFWKSDRRMALEELADLGPDVVATFGKEGVSVVGIAVNEAAATAPNVLKKAGASFPNLLDADGKAFAQVGSERLPRTYLLDPSGKILWFDIEYSHATRRELHQALRAATSVAGAKQE